MSEADWKPALDWVREREAIRLAKAAGKLPPWTKDQCLQTYRFCNVRREDDIVTLWIKEHLRDKYRDHDHLWLILCVARQLNLVSTLNHVRHNTLGLVVNEEWWHPNVLETVLRGMVEDSLKVYGAAYIIPAPPKGGPKYIYTAQTVIGQLYKDRDKITSYIKSPAATLEGMHRTLKRYQGWGDFLAYQAVVDMRFTPQLDKAKDIETWAAAGPGTIRGLNRIHKRPVAYALSQGQALSELRQLYKIVEHETGVKVDFSDCPNIMCETDKYLRWQTGDGTPKVKYVAGRGF